MKIKNFPKEKYSHTGDKNRGWVYLLLCGGLFKIGIARRLEERLMGISILMPFEIEFVTAYYTDNPRELERDLHETFKDKRLLGEWFRLNQDDVLLFRSLGELELRPELLTEQKQRLVGRPRKLFERWGEL